MSLHRCSRLITLTTLRNFCRFLYITDDEALIALREQEQRYNSRRRRKKARISFGESDARRWSGDSQTINKRDKIDTTVPLPDYLKAKIDREEDIRKKGGLKNAITHGAMNWLHAGVIRASEIVQVHPAAHVDPYSKTDQLGTPSLRLSQTPYVKSNTFSVILPSMQGKLVKQHFPSADMTEKWYVFHNYLATFRALPCLTSSLLCTKVPRFWPPIVVSILRLRSGDGR